MQVLRTRARKNQEDVEKESSGDALEFLKFKAQENVVIQKEEIELCKQQITLEKQKLEASQGETSATDT